MQYEDQQETENLFHLQWKNDPTYKFGPLQPRVNQTSVWFSKNILLLPTEHRWPWAGIISMVCFFLSYVVQKIQNVK